jgi:hypothetical protein
MSDGNELLGKADALLARLRSSTDSEFPVLTEIVEVHEHAPPPAGPLSVGQSAPRNTPIDLDDLCNRLKARLLEEFEPATMRWIEESLLSNMRAAIEISLSKHVEKVAREAEAALYARIERTIDEVIEREIQSFKNQ